MSEPTYSQRFDVPQIPPRRFHNGQDEPRRPLVDFVTNEWQKGSSYRDSSFDSQDSYSNFVHEKSFELAPEIPEWIRRLQNTVLRIPRRVQRALAVWSLFLIALWLYYLYWLAPAWEHEKILDSSADEFAKAGAAFGVNMRPHFHDIIHMADLDTEYLPRAGAEDRRLIFIGDVHGCKDEFEQLLAKVNFDQERDHLILTGDLIAKGPDSTGAVALAMANNASCVRGNWEDRTLLAHNAITSKVQQLPGPAEDPATKEDYLDEESFNHGDYKDRALAKILSKEQIVWLRNCPVILKVGRLENFNGGGEIVACHAGLVPGIPLDNQDPYQVMNMRTIDLKTRVPSEDRDGEPWEQLWNHHQAHLKHAVDRSTVVYGHDAKRGLNLKKYSKGLDSGCLKGGSLTALVLGYDGKQKTVSVACNGYKK